MIGIIDFDMGNLKSIANMIKKIGYDSCITRLPDEISAADKLILPGVGSFDQGIKKIRYYGLDNILHQEVIKQNKKILGICLGMQLMMSHSEEGSLKGLSWIEGDVKKFKFSSQQNLKIPHMGWNTVDIQKENILLEQSERIEERFYFVHSYYVTCSCPENILATSFYGNKFVASFQRENIFGVQFHPEKSHRFGKKLLANFLGIKDA